jgi:hypothetical protein
MTTAETEVMAVMEVEITEEVMEAETLVEADTERIVPR